MGDTILHNKQLLKTQLSSLLSSEITSLCYPASNNLRTRLPAAMIPKEARGSSLSQASSSHLKMERKKVVAKRDLRRIEVRAAKMKDFLGNRDRSSSRKSICQPEYSDKHSAQFDRSRSGARRSARTLTRWSSSSRFISFIPDGTCFVPSRSQKRDVCGTFSSKCPGISPENSLLIQSTRIPSGIR